MKLNEMTAHELSELMVKGELSSTEITEAVFGRIEEVEDKIHSYISLTRDLALTQAKKVDDLLSRGEEIPPLAGIPFAIKDILCIDGLRTTCGSKILENFVPPYNATVIEKLLSSDSVFVGRTNMDEFAMGSSTENSYFGPTYNPWDRSTIPGGSSGGSAAAVAADETILALGTDTGGSIRQPAAMCGVVGLKPTYGRVSRYGLIAYASSLDQIGPIAKDVTDCALIMNVIGGYDPRDSTSADLPLPDYTKSLTNDVKGMKIGVPPEFFTEGVMPEVELAVKKAVDLLVGLSAEADEVSLPHIEYGIPAYYLIAMSEASSNLARYDGMRYGYRTNESLDMIDSYRRTRREGFGSEVRRRILLGTYALSAGYYDAYYLKAAKVRTIIKQDFDKAFEKFDVIITPTSPVTAFKIGEKVDDPLQMYLVDICTVPINLAGLPAISIPCGFHNGLPIGLQIIAKPFAEETILRVAYTFEQNTDHHKQKPRIN